MTTSQMVRALSIDPQFRSVRAVTVSVPYMPGVEPSTPFTSNYRNIDLLPGLMLADDLETEYQVALLSNRVDPDDPDGPAAGFRFARSEPARASSDAPPINLTKMVMEVERAAESAMGRTSIGDVFLPTILSRRFRYLDCTGTGLLVAFKVERDLNNQKIHRLAEAIDLEWSAGSAARYIAEWTVGSNGLLPRFTCAFRERFDEPWKREVVLRLENRDELATWYNIELDQPIKQHTPEVVDFSLAGRQVTVMVGRCTTESKVRVVILRTDDPQLGQIAGTTLSVEKAPKWVAQQLDVFFEQELRKRVGMGRAFGVTRRYEQEKAKTLMAVSELQSADDEDKWVDLHAVCGAGDNNAEVSGEVS